MEGQKGHCKELGKCGEGGGGVWEEQVAEGWEAARSRGKVKQLDRTQCDRFFFPWIIQGAKGHCLENFI